MNYLNGFFILLAVIFAYIIVKSTIRKKMLEHDSIRWIFLTILVLILGFFPGLVQELAMFIGVDYAPSLLFLLSTLVLVYFVLRQSMQIAELSSKVRELAQRNAIMEQDIKDLEKDNKATN